ncbi:NAD(P)-dependent alcohol dehydrogenase [Mucilaginibacter lacusdianchii]|uniref:NAD(P)-dependent alcohol dehydrogenase n=1 Tax=Mucilaginibacter lacusdianchii TaxID=2684211 RepID=UPI00131E1B41|nr:NAD(P)-dependent alcohol dehydrogenase [Mucilaginibacter sp. JXJ CY 39]
METKEVKAYGTASAEESLSPMQIPRRTLLPEDVEIEILYCGICHTDLHVLRNDWGGAVYPIVPGHEIVGRVTAAGDQVTKFKVGDVTGVGCLVDSCRHCAYCQAGLEQFCEPGNTVVFGWPDKHLGGHTFGGFSERIIVDQNYVLRVPGGLDAAAAAPLLCAGITVYSPLRHWKAGAGSKVGVIGIGGLGHLAIKMASAMGAEVTVFTTSEAKADDARALGATEVFLSTDADRMPQSGKLDLIIDTVSAQHDINVYLHQLRVDGTLVLVGLPPEQLPMGAGNVVHGRKAVAGSNIGGIGETQEMLDFCAERGITADIETIAIQDVDQAFKRLEKGDVKYRFVVDMRTLQNH